MREYKTPAEDRERMKVRRDAIKAAGGEAYSALLAREREQRAKWRKQNRWKVREYERKNPPLFRTMLCAKARARGRERGIEATITPDDLVWPTHCPVLGIKLDYPKRSGQRKDQPAQPNWPSLDRWDSTKGYVPGNVFVISMRANTLKNSATLEETLRIAEYLKRPPGARCVAGSITELQAAEHVDHHTADARTEGFAGGGPVASDGA
jgi:hypothetical protein